MVKRTGKLLIAVLLMLPVGQAWGGQNGQGQNNNNQGTRGVPEISPGALPALGAILVGFSLLMTHRRKSVDGA